MDGMLPQQIDPVHAATAGDSQTSRNSSAAKRVITPHHANSRTSQMPGRSIPAREDHSVIASITGRRALFHISSTISHAVPRRHTASAGSTNRKYIPRYDTFCAITKQLTSRTLPASRYRLSASVSA